MNGEDVDSLFVDMSQSLLNSSEIGNVDFIYATTKTDLPFYNGQFDLIYDRRGPTSIIDHGRILTSGGTIFGIHNNVDAVKERLTRNGYTDVIIEEYNEAITYFPNEEEFAKFLSDIPGNPDFTSSELKKELEVKIRGNMIDGKLGFREHKYIWKATKP